MTGYSRDCVELVKEFEGCRLESYLCPAGIPTCGTGHTGPEVHLGMTCTQEQAEAWLADDLDKACKRVMALVHVPLSQGQIDALTSFVFNLGSGRLMASTLLAKLNDGDYEGAGGEFRKWVYGGGKILPGLVKRRAAEAALFMEGV